MKQWIRQRWARLCAAISFVLTSLSAVPYDMGQISLWIPPKYKVVAFAVGGVLFVIFQLIQRQKPKMTGTVQAEVLHIYHHYPEKEI